MIQLLYVYNLALFTSHFATSGDRTCDIETKTISNFIGITINYVNSSLPLSAHSKKFAFWALSKAK